jgi:hypothetical protein
VREAYLDSIRSFNNFFEEEPRKIGPYDFIDNFDELITSIKTHGFQFSESDEAIALSRNLKLINGAHRVAISAALGLTLEVLITESDESEFDSQFFIDRGIKSSTLELSLQTKARIDTNLHCVIIHGIVSSIDRKRIEQKLSLSANIFFSKDVTLTFSQLFYLKYVNYVLFSNELPSWQGNASNGFEGIKLHAVKSMGASPTSFFFVTDISQFDLIQLKNDIRKSLSSRNFGIHSTDSPEEVFELANLSTRNFALNRNHVIDYNFRIVFLERLRIARKLLDEKFQGKLALVAGSAVMEIFGLRDSRDLDIFIESNQAKDMVLFESEQISICSIKNLNLSFPLEIFSLDPEKTFSFAGLEFLSLSELEKFKFERAEYPKDINDLKLITGDNAGNSEALFIGKVYSFIRFRIWKFYSVLVFAQNSFKSRLAQHPRLFAMLKRFRDNFK